MEKKIIIFCILTCIVMVGLVCGLKIYSTMSGPNSAIASIPMNNKISPPNITATSQPQQKKEFETHNVEPIPDLVTLMLATPEKK